jgi:phenylpropionate dioxygenase-like ring-hydroxylating dioxygenase large terminal subunit
MWFKRNKAIKDGRSRFENQHTQPLRNYSVFNNPEVVTRGWYPVIPSSKLGNSKTFSWTLGVQRLVFFRGVDGKARALDAFCPHMGADLYQGKVIKNDIQCYFHQWQFNGEGRLTEIPCRSEKPRNVQTAAYPVEEKFGWIWVFSSREKTHQLPAPAGLENLDLYSVHLGSPVLFAHHHVMMASGIDIQHFATVHNLDIKFQLSTRDVHPEIFDWDLHGDLPKTGWRCRLARKLIGQRVGYIARFAGGSVVTLTYNPEGTRLRLGPFEIQIPPLHIYWGCVPLDNGVSRVEVFAVSEKRKGVTGWIKNRLLLLTTLALLIILRDDDVKAFPGMRFNTGHLLPIDSSVAKLIQKINGLPVSLWSKRFTHNQSSTEIISKKVHHEHPPANA